MVIFFSIAIACGAGKYRSDLDSTCKVCPPNSKSASAASAECPCLSGYFRAPSEGAGASCTGEVIILHSHPCLQHSPIL